jgi:CubicO group peptidase (beta-lactamase class C family)
MNPNVSVLTAALVAALFCHAPLAAQSGRSDQQISANIDEYMKAAVEIERFSGSILVARDGRAIVSKSYGDANVELGVPNTPKTVFRIASLTKQFTAAAIMILQERGELRVADSICKHLTDCPPTWHAITIHHLLTMTSGIPDVTNFELGPLRGLPAPWDQWLAATKRKPVVFKPGDDFAYTRSAYVLLGFIIEQVSGKPYGDFLQENIFSPLGMNQTGYEEHLRIVKNRATGYRYLPDEPITNVPHAEIQRLYAAGGLYSTTEDLLLWDQALYRGKILSADSINAMSTPFKDMHPGKGYAYGWWASTKRGHREIAHGGNLAGFITYFARYPTERVTIIVLSNNGRGSSGKISDVLSAIVFGDEYEMPRKRQAIPVELPVLSQYLGNYDAAFPPTKYTISLEGGKLFFEEIGFIKAELFAESDTDFFIKTADMQVQFIKDAKSAVTGLVVYQGDGTLYEVMNARKLQ